jgi:hypothetical protein
MSVSRMTAMILSRMTAINTPLCTLYFILYSEFHLYSSSRSFVHPITLYSSSILATAYVVQSPLSCACVSASCVCMRGGSSWCAEFVMSESS